MYFTIKDVLLTTSQSFVKEKSGQHETKFALFTLF